MAAAYCYEGIPLRFLASLFDIQMRYLVYMRYLWFKQKSKGSFKICHFQKDTND